VKKQRTADRSEKIWTALRRIDDAPFASQKVTLWNLGALIGPVLRSGEATPEQLGAALGIEADLCLVLAELAAIWTLADETGFDAVSLWQAVVERAGQSPLPPTLDQRFLEGNS